MDGLKNFLQLINDNWTTIIVIIGLALGLGQKVKTYFANSNDEKIRIAKIQVKEVILKMITEAEVDYEDWNKAGSIKRSQVIDQVFEKYPILSKAVNQDELIKWIDDAIDNSLKTLRVIVKDNKTEKTTE